MKKILTAVLLVMSVNVMAQVYAPDRNVICQPKQIPTPNGIIVVIVCQ